MTDDVIHFSNVTLRYPESSRAALEGVDLRIGTGESVVVVGPSGSGKTSLLRLVNALVAPSEGTVSVDGLDTAVDENVWEVRRRVGLIFQNPDNQLVSTTVERELAFGMENLGLPQGEIVERVEEALVRFRLEGLRHRAPHRLSGGEKQRVAIAAVIAMRPSCLLLDEPTSLLDAAGRGEVWRVLEELRSDAARTVVHVTQFPGEIAFSTRVLVVQAGKIVFDGSPDALFALEKDLGGWGLRAPAAVELAGRLREGGYDIPDGVLTLDGLVEAVAASRGGGRA